jgi:casein kinase 1
MATETLQFTDGNDVYQLGRLIGRGAFGECYSVMKVESGEKACLKLEHKDAKHPQLGYEARVLKHLQGAHGIPKFIYYGTEGDYHIMIMERLRKNVSERLQQVGGQFSIATTTLLIIEMLRCVEALHNKGIIHRDLKPENFMFDRSNNLYIIDFGLSKCFRTEIGEHIPFRKDKNLVGTPRYASINNHMGFQQSRRDDLESIGYIVVFLMKGVLPWMNIRKKDKKEKHYEIMNRKNTVSDELCNALPYEYGVYLKYVKGLKYDEDPDYDFLRKIFYRLLRVNPSWGEQYDWEH